MFTGSVSARCVSVVLIHGKYLLPLETAYICLRLLLQRTSVKFRPTLFVYVLGIAIVDTLLQYRKKLSPSATGESIQYEQPDIAKANGLRLHGLL